MWSNGGRYSSPWRWAWLAVLLLVTLVSLKAQTNPLDNLKEALMTLKLQVTDLNKQISSLQETAKNARQSSQESQQTITALEATISDLQNQVNALTMNSEESKKLQAESAELVKTLQKQLTDASTSLKNLQNYIKVLENSSVPLVVLGATGGFVLGIVTAIIIESANKKLP